MASSAPAVVFGTAAAAAWSSDMTTEFFEILEKHNVKELDTAYIYSGSEDVLGKAGAAKRFTIDTKAPGFREGALAKQSIIDGMNKSLKELGVDSVNIYYFHAPDPSTPIEDSLSAIDQLYKEGKFKRFGLSNFKPADVQKIYDIQAGKKSVLPSVFQGNYNAVSRHIESDLFPLLHKLKISFFAYSPIAGGFLVKDSKVLRAGEDTGRFGGQYGAMYNSLYGKETLYKALDEWTHIAADEGITKAALAYRWIAHHSALKHSNGDAIIIGATKTVQLEESLKAVEAGPLGKKSVEKIEAIWKAVEAEAPLDNYHSFAAASK